ncbi:unnamed protein product [Protopolystoma xenopodis]|uniref:DOMON domain-containing protein n=1 Tax=Protopolystoma xenopodis TaxID=117903 RepID=A0A448XK70_9PLAT|nr:unnamed protein product [Protopolystoma xenopodis]
MAASRFSLLSFIVYTMLSHFLLVFCCVFSVNAFTPVTLEGCEITKGCMKPPICTDERCSFMATWMIVDVGGNLYVEIELMGDVKSQGGYVSLAFSDDDEIGNDGVVGCYHEPTSSIVVIKAAYNGHKSDDQSVFYSSDDPSMTSHALVSRVLTHKCCGTAYLRFNVEPQRFGVGTHDSSGYPILRNIWALFSSSSLQNS